MESDSRYLQYSKSQRQGESSRSRREKSESHRDRKRSHKHYREKGHRSREGKRHHHHHRHHKKYGSDDSSTDKNYKESKGNLLGSADSCKYDVPEVDDFRHSNDSESHRKNVHEENRSLSEILQADFDDDESPLGAAVINEEVSPRTALKRHEEELEQENGSSQRKRMKMSDDEIHSSGSSTRSNITNIDNHSPDMMESRNKSPEIDSLNPAGEQEPEDDNQENVKLRFDENLPNYYPAIEGCRTVDEFQCLNRIAEGTYGVVYRFRDKRTDDIVALKKLKMEKEKEGFPITSLREINTLLKGQHENIVTVREIVFGSNSMDKIFIVMDYVEHDLKSLMELMKKKEQRFATDEVKCLLKQLLLAVAHLHDNWILHRDLKTSNLLLSHKGILKVGDFGLAREYGSPLRPYTPIVVTLWYRAPELLLGARQYSTPIDLWSVGCIFAELVFMNPLFPGKSEIEQINKIFKFLGSPNEKMWPGYKELPVVQKTKLTHFPVSNLRKRFQMMSDLGLHFLLNFLTYDPSQRITAEEALKHPYFYEFPPPIDPSMFPKWPAKSEISHKRAVAASPKAPSGGGQFKKLGDEDGFRIDGTENNRVGAGFSLKF